MADGGFGSGRVHAAHGQAAARRGALPPALGAGPLAPALRHAVRPPLRLADLASRSIRLLRWLGQGGPARDGERRGERELRGGGEAARGAAAGDARRVSGRGGEGAALRWVLLDLVPVRNTDAVCARASKGFREAAALRPLSSSLQTGSGHERSSGRLLRLEPLQVTRCRVREIHEA